MKSLKARVLGKQPEGKAIKQELASSQDARPPKLVVAHFMLGNTYPFNEDDWSKTFDVAEETGLDALALNLGPEGWQYQQALSAFRMLTSRPSCDSSTITSTSSASSSEAPSSKSKESTSGFYKRLNHKRNLKLFISMDMMVLPSTTVEQSNSLRDKMLDLLKFERVYLKWEGKKVVSTFGGHDAALGGKGWKVWLSELNAQLKEEVYFWPSFFLPPETLLNTDYIDGIFNWNASWLLDDSSNSTISSDEPFLVSRPEDDDDGDDKKGKRRKGYMTSISPLFFTHYGTEGEWAFNKNWIYPSDDLLLPRRLEELLKLRNTTSTLKEKEKLGQKGQKAKEGRRGRRREPDILQIISWNDYGESHYICPVDPLLGAQPGSGKWVNGMDHDSFRELISLYISLWRDSKDIFEILGKDEIRVWVWYRLHPKDTECSDRIGKPDRGDQTKDLINVVALVPRDCGRWKLTIENGGGHEKELESGMNMWTVPFIVGKVSLSAEINGEIKLVGEGKEILGESENYNYNMWSRTFSIPL